MTCINKIFRELPDYPFNLLWLCRVNHCFKEFKSMSVFSMCKELFLQVLINVPNAKHACFWFFVMAVYPGKQDKSIQILKKYWLVVIKNHLNLWPYKLFFILIFEWYGSRQSLSTASKNSFKKNIHLKVTILC